MIKNYRLNGVPQARPENMILGKHYRITLLTEGLVRMEYSEDGSFEDRATQTVLNRDFAPVTYECKETEEELVITTRLIRLTYNRKAFSRQGLHIQVYSGGDYPFYSIWYYGDQVHDLKGTARTLDEVDGACELGSGVVSRHGFAVLDDSKSLVITDEGWVEPRRNERQDFYFFGYAHDYLGSLKAFYHLCGKTPMLPRFALGNWWSRYYEYTQESYLELMHRFDEEGIAFSVAVIDMDWHLVDVDPKYGSGWTGYTWNKDFFPDPAQFMDKLHERGMRITLNVHPADGVRGFEEMYEEMGNELGVDTGREEPIVFDVTSQAFLNAYFKYLHHPNEDKGVDFWWIDWQQGGVTRMEGLDPLWMLNHYHFLDSARDGKRPMTFSRYAGPGSHRYPVGFSGDTVVTWESLRFQPYFTGTASNIGYGWWSHDIGGHMQGYKDDELEGRWYQLGVFSPINRLHSTKNEFNGKEPWRFKPEIRSMMDDYLRLRHKLVPYLYSMNYRAWCEDTPLILPIYYYHAEYEEAYKVPNEYYFGSQLIAAPVTTGRMEKLNRAKVKTWLPEGTYIDFFNGLRYEGGRVMDMYRSIQEFPLLAKAGAIIPMTDRTDAVTVQTNPAELRLRIFAGADNEFCLYEDDNETMGYEKDDCVKTAIRYEWNGEQKLTVGPAEGNTALIPEKRSWVLEFVGGTFVSAEVTCNGAIVETEATWDEIHNTMEIRIKDVPVTQALECCFKERQVLGSNHVAERVYAFLNQAEIEFDIKERVYKLVRSGKNPLVVISTLQSMELDEELVKCISEIVTA